MLYALIGHDAPQSLATRRRVRPEHLARIQALANAGRVAIAGPCPVLDSTDPGDGGFTGSIIIAEFSSLAEAKAWLSADPYVTEGVFTSTEVRPFIKVLP